MKIYFYHKVFELKDTFNSQSIEIYKEKRVQGGLTG
jgi:hypothetical protein